MYIPGLGKHLDGLALLTSNPGLDCKPVKCPSGRGSRAVMVRAERSGWSQPSNNEFNALNRTGPGGNRSARGPLGTDVERGFDCETTTHRGRTKGGLDVLVLFIKNCQLPTADGKRRRWHQRCIGLTACRHRGRSTAGCAMSKARRGSSPFPLSFPCLLWDGAPVVAGRGGWGTYHFAG